MGFLHSSICPPYVELKIVEYQPGTNTMGETHNATKMPQLLCVKLEDKKITSQALRRSRAVIHLLETRLPIAIGDFEVSSYRCFSVFFTASAHFKN